jgi:hypothetical protein
MEAPTRKREIKETGPMDQVRRAQFRELTTHKRLHSWQKN